jgi:radical SAM superfamily enzyme YgiQ (UPF0313 family)
MGANGAISIASIIMKACFLNPPWWQGRDGSSGLWSAGVRSGSRWPFTMPVRSSPDRFCWGGYLPSPLFMQFAASYLQHAAPDATIHFRDSIALRESYDSFYRFVSDGQYDFVVLESATPCWPHDSEIIRNLHRRDSKTKIIVTGPITVNHAQILAELPVWATVRGEYERGVVRAIVGGESGLIDFDFLSQDEMNAAPSPYMDATIAHRYYDPCPKGQMAPQAHVWTTRGCWAKCCFCVFPAVMTSDDPDGTKRRTVRYYSPDYMREYLLDMKAKYNFRSIWVDDDVFNLGDKHVRLMCEVFREVGLPWSAMCRGDRTKPETWKAMKDAGCFAVKIGVESASQQVLDTIVNKQLDLGELMETLELLKSIGMAVHTTWTVGLPGETPAQQQETIAMIQRLYDRGLHATHQLSGTAQIEGTPLHQIGTGSVLAKYPGAKVDENYVAEGDGAKKLAEMMAK